ncbi:MAG: thiamine pyrophosphate-requiring protein [Saccharolobus sp.]|uniref:Thiamine pyrophosphate-requiring protein n=1 Tax=Saccharolobus shibatae (strain ATCC 51178 / DSM 5389 / JCM 8931 / NBRC 15437 / B12) TaxID=523848 RepID=A0A8F5GU15_SACSH|nr:thiamine pyrophosphate-requiring protein [Saccharolobus shibatae]MCH4815812.1 thiamine pyrophosphate-requiring protein [Saccharolobus shibatae]QXJ28937.1 Thiamine pyrophosphate-requiring protein [Saccharolobus shibatae B12]
MPTGARLLLKLLKDLGVEKIFIVGGTDHAALIEEKVKDPYDLPDLEEVPHEIVAASAALGQSFLGKIGAVLVHTTPGTANVIGILMDAFTMRLPLIVLAGRSPYTEKGSRASRNVRIHWPQEIENQTEIVKPWVKYAFEIKRVEQIPETVSRAIQIALSEPKGPVYIVFPREVTVEETEYRHIKMEPFEPAAPTAHLEKAKKMIEEAERPVIITWNAGKRRDWFKSLVKFADTIKIPVINYIGGYVNYPSNGKMALDSLDLSQSDLLIVVENDVPWIPKKQEIKGKVIRVDTDPSYRNIPFYGFQCDLCIQSTVSEFFDRLVNSLNPKDDHWVVEERERQVKEKIEEIERLSKSRKIHPRYLSYEIGKVAKEESAIIVNEYVFNPKYAELTEFGSYLGEPSAGYLGWGLGASVGIRSLTDRLVIAIVGDGQFIFGVPEAFYYLAVKYPLLTIIYDNGGWLATENAVKEVYPDGVAVAKGVFPATTFRRYNIGQGVIGYGGYFKLIERTEEVRETLLEAINYIKQGKPAIIQAIVERAKA